MIRMLEPDVQSRLRSGVALTSYTQAVEELVLNSLDARSTCLAVRVDLGLGRIQVVDNGLGMSRENLRMIGTRYATSKCHVLSDLDNLVHYGYRGEALASIMDSCLILEVESRHKTSTVTLTRIFNRGRAGEVTPSSVHRPSHGTTFTVHDLFFSFPVRKKGLNEVLEFERIRHRMEAIALVHPQISFSLRNDASGAKALQTHKANSVLGTFSHLFGTSKSRFMKQIENTHKELRFQGYISTEGHSNKNLQFVYINDRIVLKTRLHKLVNCLLSKSSISSKRKASAISKFPEKPGPTDTGSSPGRQMDRYAMFVINVSCPLSRYDITFDPAKTLVEFHNWSDVLKCVEDAVNSFLMTEGLVASGDSEDLSTSLTDLQSLELGGSPCENPGKAMSGKNTSSYGDSINTSEVSHSLRSVTVKRRRPQFHHSIVPDAPSNADGDPTESFDQRPASPGRTLSNAATHNRKADPRRTSHTDSTEVGTVPSSEEPVHQLRATETLVMDAVTPQTIPSQVPWEGPSGLLDTDTGPDKVNSTCPPITESHNVLNETVSGHDYLEGFKKIREKFGVPQTVYKMGLCKKTDKEYLLKGFQKIRAKLRAQGLLESSFPLQAGMSKSDCEESKAVDNKATLMMNQEPQPPMQHTPPQDTSDLNIRLGQTDDADRIKYTQGYPVASVVLKRTAADKPATVSSKLAKLMKASKVQLSADLRACPETSEAFAGVDCMMPSRGVNNTIKPPNNTKSLSIAPELSHEFHLSPSTFDLAWHPRPMWHDDGLSDEFPSLPQPLSLSHLDCFPPEMKQACLVSCESSTISRKQQFTLPDGQTQRFAACDPRSVPRDSMSAPCDPMSFPSDPMSAPCDPMSFPSDPMSVSGDPISVLHDPIIVQGDPLSVPSDHMPVPNDPKPASDNSMSVLYDPLSIQKDAISVAVDQMPAQDDPIPTSDDPLPAQDDPITTSDDPLPTQDDPIPTSDDPLPAPDDPIPISDDLIPTSDDPIPAPNDPIPTSDDPMPAPDDPIPISDDPIPAPNNSIPTSDDPMPAPDDSIPILDDSANIVVASISTRCGAFSDKRAGMTRDISHKTPEERGSASYKVTEMIQSLYDWKKQFHIKMSSSTRLHLKNQAEVDSGFHKAVATNDDLPKEALTPEYPAEYGQMMPDYSHSVPTFHLHDESCSSDGDDLPSHRPRRQSQSLDNLSTMFSALHNRCKNANPVSWQEESEEGHDLCVIGPSQGFSTTYTPQGLSDTTKGFQDTHKHTQQDLNQDMTSLPDDAVAGNEGPTPTRELKSIPGEAESVPPQSMDQHIDESTRSSEGKGMKIDQLTNVLPPPAHHVLDELTSPLATEKPVPVSDPPDLGFVDLHDDQSSAADLTKHLSDSGLALSSDSLDDNHQTHSSLSPCSTNNKTTERVSEEAASGSSELALWRSDSQTDAVTSPHTPCDIRGQWLTTTDYASGRMMYINVVTGNSSFQDPRPRTTSSLAAPSRACKHRFLGFEAGCLLPRSKEERSGRVTSSDLQTVLHSMLDEHEASYDDHSKWKDGFTKPETEDTDTDSVAEMYSQWKNPTFVLPDKGVVSGEVSSLARSSQLVHQTLSQHSFSKPSLSSLTVLSQVDNKFIICLMKTGLGDTGEDYDMVVVIDQHAAHERVRLESLIEGAYEATSANQRRQLAMSQLDPPLHLHLPDDTYRILNAYQTQMYHSGVAFSIDPAQKNTVLIQGVPSCLMEREANEAKRGRPSVASDIILALLKEETYLLEKTHGANCMMPKAVMRVLASQACHGAIKFGDALARRECEKLVSALSLCDLPFQCAHGRPSIIPLLDLKHIPSLHTPNKTARPRLSKLTLAQSDSTAFGMDNR